MSNVIPLRREPPRDENKKCQHCGSEWWRAVVVFNQSMTRVVGWHVSGDAAALIQCDECGERP